MKQTNLQQTFFGTWSRCIVICIASAFLFNVGQEALAPGGKYVDAAMQSVSHDPRTYDWGILDPHMLPVIVGLSVYVLAFTLVFWVAFATALATVIYLWPAARRRFASVPLLRAVAAVGTTSFIHGMQNTIIEGRNLGMFS